MTKKSEINDENKSGRLNMQITGIVHLSAMQLSKLNFVCRQLFQPNPPVIRLICWSLWKYRVLLDLG